MKKNIFAKLTSLTSSCYYVLFTTLRRPIQTVYLTAALIVGAPCTAPAIVYSVDSLIDVDRMAADKMYYDLYQNPNSQIFTRSDLKTLSPAAIAIMEKAIQSKIDAATAADQAQKADLAKQTGANTCAGDPYIGGGTAVVPDIQDLAKPGCLQGGATNADQSMGYVYKVDRAFKAKNAKEASDEVFRSDAVSNAVPRVNTAPSADQTDYMDKWTVHDDGKLFWLNGAPYGVWNQRCQPGGTGTSCYVLEETDPKDNPPSVAVAEWADSAATAGKISSTADPTKITVIGAEWTLNKSLNWNVATRTYTFLINNYTITKDNVLFCDIGWTSFELPTIQGQPGLGGPGSICGGNYNCVESCAQTDGGTPSVCDTSTPPNCTAPIPPQCIQANYDCVAFDVCMSTTGGCGNISNGSITVSNMPQTISVTANPGDDQYEPANIRPGIIEDIARGQLPDKVLVGTKSIRSITKCDGPPGSTQNCH